MNLLGQQHSSTKGGGTSQEANRAGFEARRGGTGFETSYLLPVNPLTG
jgi:hypothetical protein